MKRHLLFYIISSFVICPGSQLQSEMNRSIFAEDRIEGCEDSRNLESKFMNCIRNLDENLDNCEGSGQQGIIYNLSKEDNIVVKIVSLPLGEDLTNIRQEVATINELKGTNVGFDFKMCVQTSDKVYIVQEKLHKDLSDKNLLTTFRNMGKLERLEIFSKLARKFEVMHGLNLVHQDVKPENLMTRYSDLSEIVVIDFGVSGKIDQVKLAGTPYYSPPSKIKGINNPELEEENKVTFYHDVYGLVLTFASMESEASIFSGLKESCFKNMIQICFERLEKNVEIAFAANGMNEMAKIAIDIMENKANLNSMKKLADSIDSIIKASSNGLEEDEFDSDDFINSKVSNKDSFLPMDSAINDNNTERVPNLNLNESANGLALDSMIDLNKDDLGIDSVIHRDENDSPIELNNDSKQNSSGKATGAVISFGKTSTKNYPKISLENLKSPRNVEFNLPERKVLKNAFNKKEKYPLLRSFDDYGAERISSTKLREDLGKKNQEKSNESTDNSDSKKSESKQKGLLNTPLDNSNKLESSRKTSFRIHNSKDSHSRASSKGDSLRYSNFRINEAYKSSDEPQSSDFVRGLGHFKSIGRKKIDENSPARPKFDDYMFENLREDKKESNFGRTNHFLETIQPINGIRKSSSRKSHQILNGSQNLKPLLLKNEKFIV